MEISFTVRRGGDDQPPTFDSWPRPCGLRRGGLQATAQQPSSGRLASSPRQRGTSLTAQNVFSRCHRRAAAAAPPALRPALLPVRRRQPADGAQPDPAVATAAAAAATGMAQPDLTRMVERIHRMSGAVAGSIFQDLLAGAIQPGEAGPPPASDAAIDKLVREAAPVEGQGQCSVCLADLAASDEIIKGAPAPQCIRMPCGHRFHEKCLLQWLRSHNTCPVCRFAVEASDAPRPTPLSAVLQNWHERMRAESQAGAAMAAAGAATAAAAAAAAPASRARPRGESADDPLEPQLTSGFSRCCRIVGCCGARVCVCGGGAGARGCSQRPGRPGGCSQRAHRGAAAGSVGGRAEAPADRAARRL